jgi:hypothetical protein
MFHTWDRRRKQRRRWIRLLDSNSRSKAKNGEELGSPVLAVDFLAECHCIALWHCVSRRQHFDRMDHIAVSKQFKGDRDVISSSTLDPDEYEDGHIPSPRTKRLMKQVLYISKRFLRALSRLQAGSSYCLRLTWSDTRACSVQLFNIVLFTDLCRMPGLEYWGDARSISSCI